MEYEPCKPGLAKEAEKLVSIRVHDERTRKGVQFVIAVRAEQAIVWTKGSAADIDPHMQR